MNPKIFWRVFLYPRMEPSIPCSSVFLVQLCDATSERSSDFPPCFAVFLQCCSRLLLYQLIPESKYPPLFASLFLLSGSGFFPLICLVRPISFVSFCSVRFTPGFALLSLRFLFLFDSVTMLQLRIISYTTHIASSLPSRNIYISSQTSAVVLLSVIVCVTAFPQTSRVDFILAWVRVPCFFSPFFFHLLCNLAGRPVVAVSNPRCPLTLIKRKYTTGFPNPYKQFMLFVLTIPRTDIPASPVSLQYSVLNT